MRIGVVDYGAGNVRSVLSALGRLGAETVFTDSADVLAATDAVVFPGQGEASCAMKNLQAKGLDRAIRELRQPVLGICIGMQLLCRHSEEGDVDCLGVFDREVVRWQARDGLKVPQMGWNTLRDLRTPLFEGLHEGDFVYFVHSYHVPVCDETIAAADYLTPFSAALHRDNFFATQFHPEKSGRVGRRILENFLSLI